MKLTSITVSFILLSILSHTHASSLQDDFEDFFARFPESDIQKLLQDYVNFDPQFRHLVKYLQTDTFQELAQKAGEAPEFIDLKEYLRAAGLDLDVVFAYVEKQIAHLEPQNGIRPDNFDFKDFFADVRELLLSEQLEQLYNEKLKNSEEFKVFIEKLKSEDMRSLVEKATHADNVEQLVSRLEELKIDVTGFLQWVFVALKWSLPKIYFYWDWSILALICTAQFLFLV